jgi:hypothetical protein
MRDTIELAREAGWDDHHAEFDTRLDRLVALVRADERNRTWTQEHWTEYERSIAEAEREACAKVCEGYADNSDADHESHGYACAAAIRVREYP